MVTHIAYLKNTTEAARNSDTLWKFIKQRDRAYVTVHLDAVPFIKFVRFRWFIWYKIVWDSFIDKTATLF